MRTATVERNTKETQIAATLCLDGGEVAVSTGNGFFDHMLTAFAVHGGFGLQLTVQGDLEVDTHHTVEDTGIVLGQALRRALGDFGGIARYGSFAVPMDESLARCDLDLSNRPFLVFRATFQQERCGDYETCVTEEFWRAFAVNAGITLHIDVPYGTNAHHQIEAVFKAVGHALHEAVHRRNGQISGIVKILIQLLQPLLQRLVLQAAGDETLFRDLSQGQRPVRLRCAGSHCLKALHGHGEHAVLHLTVLEPVGGLRFGGGDEHQLAAGQGGAGTGFDGQGAQGAWDKSGF